MLILLFTVLPLIKRLFADNVNKSGSLAPPIVPPVFIIKSSSIVKRPAVVSEAARLSAPLVNA